MGRLDHWDKIQFIWIIACSGLLFGSTYIHPEYTDDWIHEFEEILNAAARDWLNKEYGQALDGFSSAQSMLRKNMSPPTDFFGWRMCLALKTYTLVLTRLIEIDIYRNEKNMERVIHIGEQAKQWADVLKKQTKDWMRVRVNDPVKKSLRNRWIVRFSEAVNHVSRLERASNHLKVP